MLDIKYIRDNKLAVEMNCKARRVPTGFVEQVISWKAVLDRNNKELEALNHERNVLADKMGRIPFKEFHSDKDTIIAQSKQIKERIARLQGDNAIVEKQLDDAMLEIPNMSLGAPNQRVIAEEHRKIPDFTFQPLDHVQLADKLDLIDFEAGADVVGSKFYYLKNDLAFLELALVSYTLKKLQYAGFTPIITPDLARTEIVQQVGFNPKGENSQIYKTGNLCLIGTSEITLAGMFRNKVIDENKLPIKLAGFSHCFRTEAGAPGKDTKGIFRVHQFSKVEMFIFCKPEDSVKYHEEILNHQKDLFDAFELPYRVVDIPIDDLGAPAARKYDIEAWIPGRNDFCEVTSASNCTDFQARRLNVKCRKGKEKARYVHTLNGTAVATTRAMIAIMENHQRENGSIYIPSVLRGAMLQDYIGKKS